MRVTDQTPRSTTTRSAHSRSTTTTRSELLATRAATLHLMEALEPPITRTRLQRVPELEDLHHRRLAALEPLRSTTWRPFARNNKQQGNLNSSSRTRL